MEFLKALLYYGNGILFRVDQGDADRVVTAEREMLLDAARDTRKKYLAGTLDNAELLIYIDALNSFSASRQTEWVCEVSAELHDILIGDTCLSGKIPETCIRTEGLQNILYGEAGIIARVRGGRAADVTPEERNELIALARGTNFAYRHGGLRSEELLIYIDIFDVLAVFRGEADWIWEISADIRDALMRDVDFKTED